jgi:hypothetical protein
VYKIVLYTLLSSKFKVIDVEPIKLVPTNGVGVLWDCHDHFINAVSGWTQATLITIKVEAMTLLQACREAVAFLKVILK